MLMYITAYNTRNYYQQILIVPFENENVQNNDFFAFITKLRESKTINLSAANKYKNIIDINKLISTGGSYATTYNDDCYIFNYNNKNNYLYVISLKIIPTHTTESYIEQPYIEQVPKTLKIKYNCFIEYKVLDKFCFQYNKNDNILIPKQSSKGIYINNLIINLFPVVSDVYAYDGFIKAYDINLEKNMALCILANITTDSEYSLTNLDYIPGFAPQTQISADNEIIKSASFFNHYYAGVAGKFTNVFFPYVILNVSFLTPTENIKLMFNFIINYKIK